MAMQDRESLSKKVTPPNSFITAPLTPPPSDSKPSKLVLKILKLIQSCARGTSALESGWHTFRLRRVEYNDFLTLLKNEESLQTFVENKFRYDYSPLTETLVLRMNTLLHEVFLARVVKEVQRRLQTFTNAESPSGPFVRNIEYNGCGRLVLNGDGGHGAEDNTGRKITRCPDATFTHGDALWPGVVIEVSYSQKTRALPHLADDYILETGGSIRVVVGLDLDYTSKKGTVSMWRPEYRTNERGQLVLKAAQTLNHQVFRDEFGSPNLSPGAGLKLELKDFAPESLNGGVSGSFLIDSTTLCAFLETAEQRHNRTHGSIQPVPPGLIRERRDDTPPEEINSEDERKFEKDEQRVEARESGDDSSYTSSVK